MNKNSLHVPDQAGISRGCAHFETHEAKFYLDNKGDIVGIQSEVAKNGEIIGEKTTFINETVKISNVIKYILNEEKYESIPALFQELNIVYGRKVSKILEEKSILSDENILEKVA